MNMNGSVGFLLTLGMFLPIASPAQQSTLSDLSQVSLEDLMNIRVTSVSKKEQKLSKAGAAVYVITQEDIRRSGATNVPDVLRMVPGVTVARIDAVSWAISIRGFTDRFADKVLVLVDRRSVYNPMYSGVNWDEQTLPLEDIERIEVIRGPGGTVWGANAVNGVINIITKSAQNSQGALVSAGAGSQTTADGLVQYGGHIRSNGAYRAFGKYFNIDGSPLAAGGDAGDGWHAWHGGFRTDWDLSSRDTVTVQGDLQRAREGQTITTAFSNALPLQKTLNERFDTRSDNLLARWNRTLGNGSEMSFQAYDDHSHRVNEGLQISQNTVDLDFQHHLAIGSRQDVVWGLGSRVASLHLGPGYSISFVPSHRTDLLLSTFFQDEVKLVNALWLTVGSKFEHNDYTGFEFEPSAQLVWTPTARQSLWASAAQAIRQPNSIDVAIQDNILTFPNSDGSFALLKLSSNPHAIVERLNDFEAGYRAQLSKRFSLDLAAFSNYYRDLRNAQQQTPYFTTTPAPPHVVLPLSEVNDSHARSHGGEIFVTWNVTRRWRISPGYSLLHAAFTRGPRNVATQIGQGQGSTPENQFQVRSLLSLPHHLEWDNSVSYTGAIAAGGTPSYTRLDSRLAWRFGEFVEFSVVGQNLLTPRHAEFPDELGVNHTLVERSGFGKITWRF